MLSAFPRSSNLLNAAADTRRVGLTLVPALALMLGLILATFAATPAAHAQSTPIRTVVELFTSQGCNSCPPADRLLQTYAKRPDVLALTLPVDYWDYLGWKDTFAKRQFTQRQYAYARKRGDNRVYTPQVVINGRDHEVGSYRRRIDARIDRHHARYANRLVPMSMETVGKKLVVKVGDDANGRKGRSGTIWLAVMKRKAVVPIRSGENGGRTLAYYNVVTSLKRVGTWNGTAATFTVAQPSNMVAGRDDCAVLLQSGTAGPIVGAAKLPGNAS
ncbi:MAG: DUF1223 domain-containing protein [Pseudomonadota bacterium]